MRACVRLLVVLTCVRELLDSVVCGVYSACVLRAPCSRALVLALFASPLNPAPVSLFSIIHSGFAVVLVYAGGNTVVAPVRAAAVRAQRCLFHVHGRHRTVSIFLLQRLIHVAC